MERVQCTLVRVVPPPKRARTAAAAKSAAATDRATEDAVESRKQRLYSPHRVVLVDCDVITRGLAPYERGATVFHELFAEIVLVETSGVPLTEVLVKDASCARLVRVAHWSTQAAPAFLIAGTVFHFVGLCDGHAPADSAEPLFICHWMALASLFSRKHPDPQPTMKARHTHR